MQVITRRMSKELLPEQRGTVIVAVAVNNMSKPQGARGAVNAIVFAVYMRYLALGTRTLEFDAQALYRSLSRTKDSLLVVLHHVQ